MDENQIEKNKELAKQEYTKTQSKREEDIKKMNDYCDLGTLDRDIKRTDCIVDGKECIKEFKCENSSLYPSYHFNGVYFKKMDWIQLYQRRCKSQLSKATESDNKTKKANYCEPEKNDIFWPGVTTNLEPEAEEIHCTTMDLYCTFSENGKCNARPENELFCDKLLTASDETLTRAQIDYMYKLYELGAIENLKTCIKNKGVDTTNSYFASSFSFLSSTIKLKEEFTIIESADFQKVIDNLDKITINDTELFIIEKLKAELKLFELSLETIEKGSAPEIVANENIANIRKLLESESVKNYKEVTLLDSITNLLIRIPTLRDPFINVLGQCNLIGSIRLKECEEKKKKESSDVDCSEHGITQEHYKNYLPTRFEVAYTILRLFYRFTNNQSLTIKEQTLFIFLFNSLSKEKSWSYLVGIDYITKKADERKKDNLSFKINKYIETLDIRDYQVNRIIGSHINNDNEEEIEQIITLLNKGRYVDIGQTWYKYFNLEQTYTLVSVDNKTSSVNELDSHNLATLFLDLDMSYVDGKNKPLIELKLSYTAKTISLIESGGFLMLKTYSFVMSFWYRVKSMQGHLTIVFALLKSPALWTLLTPILGDNIEYAMILVNFIHDVLCLLKSMSESSADTLSFGYSIWGDNIALFLTALNISSAADSWMEGLINIFNNKHGEKNAKQKIIVKTIKKDSDIGIINDKEKSESKGIWHSIIKNGIKAVINILPTTSSLRRNLTSITEMGMQGSSITKMDAGKLTSDIAYLVSIIVITAYLIQLASCTEGLIPPHIRFAGMLDNVQTFPVKISTYALKCSSDEGCSYVTSVGRADIVMKRLGLTNESIRELFTAVTKVYSGTIGYLFDQLKKLIGLFKENISSVGLKRLSEADIYNLYDKITSVIFNSFKLIVDYFKSENPDWMQYFMNNHNRVASEREWFYNGYLNKETTGLEPWDIYVNYCTKHDIDPYSPSNFAWYYSKVGKFQYYITSSGWGNISMGSTNLVSSIIGKIQYVTSSGGRNNRSTRKKIKRARNKTTKKNRYKLRKYKTRRPKRRRVKSRRCAKK